MSLLLVTFDIDGTLIKTIANKNPHTHAMADAFEKHNVPIDKNHFCSVSYSGQSDYFIAKKYFDQSNMEFNDEIYQKFCQTASENFASLMEDSSFKVLEGVRTVLEDLFQKNGVMICICSGNIPGIGEQKLKAADLWKYFEGKINGFGVCEERACILRSVIDGVKDKFGDISSIIHIGDARQDVEAAFANNAKAVYVKTGAKNYNPDDDSVITIEDMRDGHDAIFNLVEMINKNTD